MVNALLIKPNYKISKSNKFIADSIYDLTLNELRIFLIGVSSIEPKTKKFQKCSIRVVDFCNLFNIKYADNYYTYVREASLKLMSRKFHIRLSKTKVRTINWLKYCEYESKDASISFEFHDDLEPYLLNLRQNFTSYMIENILKLKSVYSYRLYEYCKLNQFKKRKASFVISVEDYKEMIGCDYKEFKNVKSRAILPQIKEINKHTDLLIDVEYVKRGRYVAELVFNITSKNSINSIYK